MTDFLSFFDRNIVKINAKVTNRNTCCLSARVFGIDNDKIAEISSIQLTFHEAFRNTNIVTCQQAAEHSTRLRCLFIVLQLVKTEKQFKYYIFALRIDLKKIVPLKQFNTSKNLVGLGVASLVDHTRTKLNNFTFPSKHISVVDGPSLFWLYGSKLYSLSTATGVQDDSVIQRYSLSDHNYEQFSMKCIDSCILWTSYMENIYLCLGISKFNINTEPRTDFFAVSFIPVSEKKEGSNFTSIDPCIFLPKEYSENVTCMNLLECQKQKNNSLSNTRLYAGTKDGYFMEFSSGRLLRAVSVWDWGPALVPPVVVEVGLCRPYQSNHTFLFIQTDQQEVVALNGEDWKVTIACYN